MDAIITWWQALGWAPALAIASVCFLLVFWLFAALAKIDERAQRLPPPAHDHRSSIERFRRVMSQEEP